jgi:hypothetical protein
MTHTPSESFQLGASERVGVARKKYSPIRFL